MIIYSIVTILFLNILIIRPKNYCYLHNIRYQTFARRVQFLQWHQVFIVLITKTLCKYYNIY